MDDYQVLGLFALVLGFCILLLILWTKTDDRSHRAVRSSRKAIQALREHLRVHHGVILEPQPEEQPAEDEFDGLETTEPEELSEEEEKEVNDLNPELLEEQPTD